MRPIDYFDTIAEWTPDAPALIDGDISLSFAELRTASERVAAALATLGAPEEPIPIALYSPNDYRVVISMLGIMRAGGVIVPLHAGNTVAVNADVLDRVRPRAVLYHSTVQSQVRAIKEKASPIPQWICLDQDLGGDPSLDTFTSGAAGASIPDWGDVTGNVDRPVFFWQTSGTTDRPKIVIDTAGTFDATLRVMRLLRRASGPGTPRTVALELAPLSHTAGGHAFVMLTLGATVVVQRSFDPPQIFRSIEQHGVTDMWMPPTALGLLLTHPALGSLNTRSLRRIDLGASAVSPETLARAVRAFGPCVSHTYSQIESGILSHLDAATIGDAVARQQTDRLLSSGRSLLVGRLAIMDEGGALLPPGDIGEIVVRGRSVKTYLDPAETAEARRHGWHHTGDFGRFDGDGFLYVVGRKRDVIITSGFKVPAAEVEQVILELPQIQDCAVIAAPDALRGESVKAVVALRPGEDVSAATILAHCRARLPRIKVPHSVDRWPELPRTAVGKIDKSRIRHTVWSAASQVQPGGEGDAGHAA